MHCTYCKKKIEKANVLLAENEKLSKLQELYSKYDSYFYQLQQFKEKVRDALDNLWNSIHESINEWDNGDVIADIQPFFIECDKSLNLSQQEEK